MPHTKRQTRRPTSRRSTSRRSTSRRVRRTRGGDKIAPNHLASCKNISRYMKNLPSGKKGFNWPDSNRYPGGCKDTPKEIDVPAETEFDRFGPPTGTFGSPLKGRTYSYTSRSLPYLRFNNNSGKLCDDVYEAQTIKDNSYHVYKVKKGAQIIGVKQCEALGAFNKPGDAIQWEFPDTIEKMLQDVVIEEIYSNSIPDFV